MTYMDVKNVSQLLRRRRWKRSASIIETIITVVRVCHSRCNRLEVSNFFFKSLVKSPASLGLRLRINLIKIDSKNNRREKKNRRHFSRRYRLSPAHRSQYRYSRHFQEKSKPLLNRSKVQSINQ